MNILSDVCDPNMLPKFKFLGFKRKFTANTKNKHGGEYAKLWQIRDLPHPLTIVPEYIHVLSPPKLNNPQGIDVIRAYQGT